MRAAVYHSNKKVLVEERPRPEIGKGEILMKVRASGICGSDVMEWYRIRKAPIVLGHEVAGTVEEVGSGVQDFKIGDRIFATHHVPCGECRYCKAGHETVCTTLRTTSFDPGGFSEFVRLPEINVLKGTIRLPDSMGFEQGTFIEPLGCVVRGQRIAGLQKGMSVLVLGSGISGLLHLMLAKSRGARIFATDIRQFRLDAAGRAGAEVFDAGAFTPEQLAEANGGRLADLVILCTGAVPAAAQAFQSVDKGGTILLFAPVPPGADVPVPLNELWSKCVKIVTSYAAAKHDLEEAVQLIADKTIDVSPIITNRLPLAEIQKGFDLAVSGENSIKVIIEPQK